MTIKAIVFSSAMRVVLGSTCQELCETVESCSKDPIAHGSYCKSSEESDACFGLFYADDTKSTMCFKPNDPTCPDLMPVACPLPAAAADIVNVTLAAVRKTLNTCQEICDDLDECRNDPQAHGSYCKFEELNPICFGLYNYGESLAKTCFQPNNVDCEELNPVACPDDEVQSLRGLSSDAPVPQNNFESCQDICESVDLCANDPQAHGSYCKFEEANPICFGLYHTDESRTSICFEPNDSGCPETLPVSCPALEIKRLADAAAAGKTSAQTLSCEQLCAATPACVNDPDAHGSYCKTWIAEPVCFGLYYTSESKETLCFEPNDSSCPEIYPVTCSA